MKRNKSFLVRLSEKEMKQLDRCVSKTGRSREEYVRTLIRGYEPQSTAPDRYYETVNELRQVTAKLLLYNESGLFSDSGGAVLYALNQLKEVCDRLQSIFNPKAGG